MIDIQPLHFGSDADPSLPKLSTTRLPLHHSRSLKVQLGNVKQTQTQHKFNSISPLLESVSVISDIEPAALLAPCRPLTSDLSPTTIALPPRPWSWYVLISLFFLTPHLDPAHTQVQAYIHNTHTLLSTFLLFSPPPSPLSPPPPLALPYLYCSLLLSPTIIYLSASRSRLLLSPPSPSPSNPTTSSLPIISCPLPSHLFFHHQPIPSLVYLCYALQPVSRSLADLPPAVRFAPWGASGQSVTYGQSRV